MNSLLADGVENQTMSINERNHSGKPTREQKVRAAENSTTCTTRAAFINSVLDSERASRSE